MTYVLYLHSLFTVCFAAPLVSQKFPKSNEGLRASVLSLSSLHILSQTFCLETSSLEYLVFNIFP
jgi:hypothetical protein